ncbi:MAG: hypothetical protein GWO24_36270 [Akkermansiaceae bacterium]|nr:hypothetical protein [Akkermansiaceae bacterium]
MKSGGNDHFALPAFQLSVASPPEPVPLVITSNGVNLDLEWDSRPGMFYILRTSTDLAADLAVWESVKVPGSVENDGVFEIATNPFVNMHTIPRPADPVRFYRVQELPLPPVAVLSDDFESGPGAWSVGASGAPGTGWQLGTPTDVGPAESRSGVNCFGTNLGGNYGPDADAWLRSPVIDLSLANEASLRYWEFRDIEEGFDFGVVRLLDAADDSELAVLETDIDGITPDWEVVTHAIPAEALGKAIKLEFRFVSDDISSFAGWYIDDVLLTTPAR